MTDAELDDLERKAKAATQGEWKTPSQPEGMVDVWVEQSIDDDVARQWGHLRAITPEIRGRDAEHIAAANPQAVLALVAEVREARGHAGELTITSSREELDGFLAAVTDATARDLIRKQYAALAAFANVERRARALESDDRFTQVPTLEWEEALRLLRAALV
jgi:hypothetical protein